MGQHCDPVHTAGVGDCTEGGVRLSGKAAAGQWSFLAPKEDTCCCLCCCCLGSATLGPRVPPFYCAAPPPPPPPVLLQQDLPMGGVASVCRPTIWAGPRPSRKSLNWLSAPSRVGKINLQRERACEVAGGLGWGGCRGLSPGVLGSQFLLYTV